VYTLNLRIKKAATSEKTMGYGFNLFEKIWFYSKLTLGSKWAEKNLAGMNLDLAPSLDITLKKLAAGRFDAFIDVSQVIRYKIRELGLKKQITELPNIIDSSTFNLCIGKKSPYLGILQKFDETLRKMKKDGTLQEIYDKYK